MQLVTRWRCIDIKYTCNGLCQWSWCLGYSTHLWCFSLILSGNIQHVCKFTRWLIWELCWMY